MSRNIRIDDLAATITEAMREYTEDVSESIALATEEIAKEVLKEVRAKAPRRTGDYAKGFKISKEDGPGIIRRTVWNRKYFFLVHLLERGHAKRGGGRTRAFPHFTQPAEDGVDKYVNRVREIIRNGGD